MSQASTADSDVPHPRYEASNRKAYGSQHEVAEAWAAGKFPTHNVSADGSAELYSSENFRGVQNPDGSGVLWHYSTREAVRTRNGLVISNRQCWSEGFAHCSTPDDIDASLPLQAVESFLHDDHDVLDIERVIGQPSESEHTGREVHRPEWSVAVLPPIVSHAADTFYGVAIGRDPSLNGDSRFAFRVSAPEIERAEREGVREMVESVLLPDAVRESDLPVVPSNEYTRTWRYGDDWSDALEAHKAAGGNTTRVERRYGDDREMILQHFRSDLQGEVIVRQGEWFYIPEPDADPEESGTAYAQAQLGNHRAERFHGARSPVPRECEHCGATKWEIETEDPRFGPEYEAVYRCKECDREAERPIYVRGQVRHADGDHDAVNLGETWHRAVTHGRDDVLVYDRSPGRSSRSRRGGRID